jgi:Phage integrase, N-terminal SAM-like domain
MARRRYQKGSIRKRGKRRPVWELQWWEDFVRSDGTIGRRRESVILGYASEITVKQARKEAEKKLNPVNVGKAVPYSTLTLQEFMDQFFLPLAFPILKSSTRKRYRSTLDLHLLPAFGKHRLCDIRTVEVQRFVLQKFDGGLGWETCNHLRNLLSKIFASARKWGHFAGTNPASGVELPEKRQVREKRVLMPEQVTRLLGLLREPVRTIGFVSGLDWVTSGGNPRLALAGRGSGGRRTAGGASRLSGLPGISEDQRQQAHHSPSRNCDRGAHEPGAVDSRANSRAVGFSIPQGDRPQRHQLAPAGFETGWQADWCALDKLAHLPAYPCHAAIVGRRLGQRCPGATGAFPDHDHPGNLHDSGSRPSAGGGRETVANGDEW